MARISGGHRTLPHVSLGAGFNRDSFFFDDLVAVLPRCGLLNVAYERHAHSQRGLKQLALNEKEMTQYAELLLPDGM